jgi:YD repeat-containing protein
MHDRAVGGRLGPPLSGWGFDRSCQPAPARPAARVVLAAGGALAERQASRLRCTLVLVVVTVLAAGCNGRPDGSVSTATSTTSPSSPSSAAPHRAGRIVFSTMDDVYVVNDDGTDLRQLTKGPAAEFDPSWSPDGRRIAYRVERGQQSADIYVMNADGSGQRRLAAGLSPAWSPDGALIAYADNQGSISVMRPDSSASRRVPGTDQGEYPSWSPDGATLAFSTPIGGKDIYRVRLDGSDRTRLTDAPGEDWQVDWSPDGRRIAFASQRDSTLGDVYVMGADGSDQRRLSTDHGFTPAWSPDGRHLVYATGAGLVVTTPDGGRATRLPLPGLGNVQLPDWVA